MAKPEFTILQEDSEAVLMITGDLTVGYAVLFKEQVGELLKAHKPQMWIKLKAVTAIDVSAMQLVFLACSQATAAGKKLSLAWPEDASLLALIEKSGFKQVLS